MGIVNKLALPLFLRFHKTLNNTIASLVDCWQLWCDGNKTGNNLDWTALMRLKWERLDVFGRGRDGT